MSVDQFFGWVPMPDESERIAAAQPIPSMADVTWLKDYGKGKTVLLYQCLEKATGKPFPVRDQGRAGTCVSQGAAAAIDCLIGVQIVMGNENIRWDAESATEPIYGGSRVEVGGGILWRDGSVGAWAAQWLTEWGNIQRGKYGQYDLSQYSISTSRDWGRHGVPDDLETTIKQYPVKAFTKIGGYTEARDALASGYPISVASNQGFTYKRDKDGFSTPSGRWGHQMAVLGVCDDPKRPGVLICNSWNIYLQGSPKGQFNIPDNMFFCDAEVFDRMAGQGDTFAFAHAVGLPAPADNFNFPLF
jgi:hypothetical protein